jgi:hypothetical protein
LLENLEKRGRVGAWEWGGVKGGVDLSEESGKGGLVDHLLLVE